MRRVLPAIALFAITLGFVVAVDAAPAGWHKSLDDGLEASAKSGKPLLVITTWKRTL